MLNYNKKTDGFMIYPVIIVGGGFSGLITMNLLIKDGIDFLLLEKNDRLGKKILATGNGRGNVSNLDLSLSHYHGKDAFFASYAVKNYDNGLIAEFFKEKGVILSAENGKLYPMSKQANSILDALRFSDNKKKAKTSAEVKDISFDEKTKVFTVDSTIGRFYAKKVVLAVGGKSSPHFGTDGKSYSLAQKFGHKLTPLYPSLVQLTTEKDAIRGLKGVKEYAKVSSYDGDKFLDSMTGDILFTDNGISGNTAFFLSSRLVDGLNPVVYVNFLPDTDDSVVIDSLKARRKEYPLLGAETFLSGLVHSRIARKTAIKVLGENIADIKYEDVSDVEIEKLVYVLKNTKIKITGNAGFSNSQVTKGGIDTKDVSPETMQSVFNPNLYLIGEVLDVDGDCGGYNLQWAFSSAMCAYKSIKGTL